MRACVKCPLWSSWLPALISGWALGLKHYTSCKTSSISDRNSSRPGYDLIDNSNLSSFCRKYWIDPSFFMSSVNITSNSYRLRITWNDLFKRKTALSPRPYCQWSSSFWECTLPKFWRYNKARSPILRANSSKILTIQQGQPQGVSSVGNPRQASTGFNSGSYLNGCKKCSLFFWV